MDAAAVCALQRSVLGCAAGVAADRAEGFRGARRARANRVPPALLPASHQRLQPALQLRQVPRNSARVPRCGGRVVSGCAIRTKITRVA
eukprot:7519720-Pyramimonas_sp.AAC.1